MGKTLEGLSTKDFFKRMNILKRVVHRRKQRLKIEDTNVKTVCPSDYAQ